MIREIKVNDVAFNRGKPLVCVPVSGSSFEELLWEIERIDTADLIEWRADFFREDVISAVSAVKKACGERPLLLTYRTAKQGGKAKVNDEEYEERIRSFISTRKIDLIDIEYSDPKCQELIDLAKKEGIVTVVSHHDFEKTDDADSIVEKLNDMEKIGADIPKIALKPNDFGDVLNLISASYKASQDNFPIITISMGKLGKLSRICGEYSGSAMTFGVHKIASAPGQIKTPVLRDILNELNK